MKSLRFRKKVDTSSPRVDTKPNLLRRFIKRTKQVFKPNPSPGPAATQTSMINSSLLLPQLTELIFQSSSSVGQDPVLGSAEWLNASSHLVHPLGTWHATTPTAYTYESNETPTPSDAASSVYSQLGVGHVDSTLPLDQIRSGSLESLTEDKSVVSCQAQLGLCRANAENVDEDEASSFQEALQLNVLDIVRRGFSNAYLRLLPSTDPILAKLNLLRRVDNLTTSSDSSPRSSDSAGSASLLTKPAAASASSANISATGGHQAGYGTEGKPVLHTHGQHSIDMANRSFFTTADAKRQHQQDAIPFPFSTEVVGDISDCLAVLFASVDEEQSSTESRYPLYPATNSPDTGSGHSFSAQSLQAIELVRGQRLLFAARLETELSMQREAMEAEFEKCYDTFDTLREIDLLNLQDDHEAEVRDLQEEREAALSAIHAVTGKKDELERDLRILVALNLDLEKALKGRCEEAESFRCQAKEIWQENNELLSDNLAYRAATRDPNAHRPSQALLLAELKYVRAERDALQMHNADLAGRNDDVTVAYEAVQKEKESVRIQLEAIVEQKAKDYSWHIQENKCYLALKSEEPELAEAKATAMARELYRQETEKVLSLRKELTDLCLRTDAQLKRQTQVIDDLSDEVDVIALALDASFRENDELAKKYQALLIAVKSNRRISELARGLAGDLHTAFDERRLFGLAFLKAEIEVVKSEQCRRTQVCDLRDLVEERNSDLAELKDRLHDAEDRVSAQAFVLRLKDDEINKAVPALKDRILEFEQIMELQAKSPGQFHTQVVTDLQHRLGRQTQIAKWYEHQFIETLHQMEGIKAEWDFYAGGLARDLELVGNFRDERDVLKIECLAMRERFADDLLREPLVVQEPLKTNKQIEDEQFAHPDERVVKQFVKTYKALPKWVVEGGCPGYEVLRTDHMEGRFGREREEAQKSFFVEGQNTEGDDLASLLESGEDSLSGAGHVLDYVAAL